MCYGSIDHEYSESWVRDYLPYCIPGDISGCLHCLQTQTSEFSEEVFVNA